MSVGIFLLQTSATHTSPSTLPTLKKFLKIYKMFSYSVKMTMF